MTPRTALASYFGGLVMAISLPFGAAADDAGAYLQGRYALNHFDFDTAARSLTRSYMSGNKSLDLIDSVMLAHVAAGEFDRAAVFLAPRDANFDGYGEIGSIVALALAAQSSDPEALHKAIEERGIDGPLLRSLMTAWARFAKGDVPAAIAALDDGLSIPGSTPLAGYIKGLILGMSGDVDAAIAFFSSEEGNAALTLSEATQLYLGYLVQNGQVDTAREEFAKIPTNTDPTYQELARALEAGEVSKLYMPRNVQDGAAEVFYLISSSLGEEVDPLFRLVYARAAQHVAPNHLPAQILAAGLLADLDRYDEALAAYPQLEASSPYYLYAQMGRADALIAKEDNAAASDALSALADAYPDSAMIWARLGDVYRYQDRYQEANDAYTKAIETAPEASPSLWLYEFSRGIVRERMKDWPNSEADLRAALERRPNNASILNYLGYSILELGGDYEEALQLIQRAVDLEPNSGHILDSLAWGYYRLGRFDQAVAPMERAAQLMPFDPIINDHLGDIYFKVGRKREAVVQWQRALSLDPEPEEAEKIRQKIETGVMPDDL